MICYSLQCQKGHAFEAWFKSSADYDAQAARKLISCPACGSGRIEKALMAPAVRRTDNRRRGRPTEAPADREPAEAGGSMAVASPESKFASRPTPRPDTRPDSWPNLGAAGLPPEMVAMLRRVRREVTAKADYVGPRFAEEARKIHYDEAPARGIYGEATPEEAAALHDEGITFHPLPRLPEDGH